MFFGVFSPTHHTPHHPAHPCAHTRRRTPTDTELILPLRTTAETPCAAAALAIDASSYAVANTIGAGQAGPDEGAASNPLRPGMGMSRTTRPGYSAAAASQPPGHRRPWRPRGSRMRAGWQSPPAFCRDRPLRRCAVWPCCGDFTTWKTGNRIRRASAAHDGGNRSPWRSTLIAESIRATGAWV